jgi:hypothetical protein
MKKVAFLVIFLAALFCISTASALTITYQTASTAKDSAGDAVSAEAIFTTSQNTLTITLVNLLVDQKDVGQNISDLYFTLGSSATSASSWTSSGNLINVAGDGTTTSVGTDSTGWLLSYSSSAGFHLDGLNGAANTPSYTILGAPGAGGVYDNANNSITGNGPHNPFLYESATFTLTIAGITADTTITGATFSFGTTSGDDVPGIPHTSVPDGGATALLLGAALTGLSIIKRRIK